MISYYELTKAWVKDHSANLTAFTLLERYVKLIEAAQRNTNLTGFSGDELWEKGIYHSLVSLHFSNLISRGHVVADVGPGAGFPSLPYLIVFPEFHLTLIEPRKKRAAFLSDVCATLNLRAKVITSEAQNVDESFDLVTAQAVSNLSNLITWTKHLFLPRGKALFIKGPRVNEELIEAKQVINHEKVMCSVIKVSDPNLRSQIFLLVVE